MEKENKEKEKSSAQKEKASRGRVAPDNLFLAKKCLYGSYLVLRKKGPCGFTPASASILLVGASRTGNYFLKEK